MRGRAVCLCASVWVYGMYTGVYIYTYVCMTCLDVYASYPSTSVHVSVQVNSCTEAKLSFFARAVQDCVAQCWQFVISCLCWQMIHERCWSKRVLQGFGAR